MRENYKGELPTRRKTERQKRQNLQEKADEGVPPKQIYTKNWGEYQSCTKPDVDPTLFYPDDMDPHNPRIREAQAICGTCPVQNMCLQQGDEEENYEGIWGGLLPLARLSRTPEEKHAQREIVVQGLLESGETTNHTLPTDTREQIQDLHKGGVLPREIAQRIGITLSQVIEALPSDGEKHDNQEDYGFLTVHSFDTQRSSRKGIQSPFRGQTINSNIVYEKDVPQQITAPEEPVVRIRRPTVREKQVKIDHQEILERYPDIQIFYERGYSQEEIAQILEVSQATISRDIRYLLDNGKLSNREKKRSKPRQETSQNEELLTPTFKYVLLFDAHGYDIKEIAEQLDTTPGTITVYLSRINAAIGTTGKDPVDRIVRADELGLLDYESILQGIKPNIFDTLTPRQRDVIEMLITPREERSSNEQIGKELGLQQDVIGDHIEAAFKNLGLHNRVYLAAVYLAIKHKQEGRVNPIEFPEDMGMRQQKLLQRLLEDPELTTATLAQELHRSRWTINNDIRSLKEQGLLTNYRRTHTKNAEDLARREEIRRRYEEEPTITAQQIAKEFDIPIHKAAYDLLKAVGPRKTGPKPSAEVETRRDALLAKLQQDPTIPRKALAQEHNVPLSTIKNDINYLIREGKFYPHGTSSET